MTVVLDHNEPVLERNADCSTGSCGRLRRIELGAGMLVGSMQEVDAFLHTTPWGDRPDGDHAANIWTTLPT